MNTLKRVTAKAERRYARRMRATDWMANYRREHDHQRPVTGYCKRIVDLVLLRAPIRVPPKPWQWYDHTLRRRVYKAVWYDDLLVLEWEAAALLTRLRLKADKDYPLIPGCDEGDQDQPA